MLGLIELLSDRALLMCGLLLLLRQNLNLLLRAVLQVILLVLLVEVLPVLVADHLLQRWVILVLILQEGFKLIQGLIGELEQHLLPERGLRGYLLLVHGVFLELKMQ